MPLIIRDSVATRWPAAKLWSDPAYIEQALPTLQQAYVLEADEANSPARRAAVAPPLSAETCEQQTAAGSESDAPPPLMDTPPASPPPPSPPPPSPLPASPPSLAPDPSGDVVESLPTASLLAPSKPPGGSADADAAGAGAADAAATLPVLYYARWMGYPAPTPSPHPLLTSSAHLTSPLSSSQVDGLPSSDRAQARRHAAPALGGEPSWRLRPLAASPGQRRRMATRLVISLLTTL